MCFFYESFGVGSIDDIDSILELFKECEVSYLLVLYQTRWPICNGFQELLNLGKFFFIFRPFLNNFHYERAEEFNKRWLNILP